MFLCYKFCRSSLADVLDRSKLPLKYRRDIDEVMKCEELSHRHDTSSLHYHGHTKKQITALRKYYREWIKNNNAFVIKKGKQLVGAIALIHTKDHKQGFVGSIWVHPKQQGKGLSKCLYNHAMENFSEAGLTTFLGYSGTRQVIDYGKKIGRVPIIYNFAIESKF